MMAHTVWPVICLRIIRSISFWFPCSNRSTSWSCRPNNLVSMIPEIDNVSWVMAVISAVAFCTSDDTARRRPPTFLVIKANRGTTPMATSVSCQDSTVMAITVLIKITTLAITSVTVEVTTFCTPPTSSATRD